jgi:RecA/RadA recombinase
MPAKKQIKMLGAVSTGSTQLNLACSDNPFTGFRKGGYYFLVGDSASGKSWLSLSCFAEACLSPEFAKHRLIFDDVEGGVQMNMAHYFGKAVAERMEPAGGWDKSGRPINSSRVEEFYYNITDAIKAGKPFIYVLDSQDALDSAASRDKFEEQKKAARQGKDAAGSYGDGKAKYHSEHIRMVLSDVRKMGSILIIIGQTRDNVTGFGFEKKIRSGGKALRFYADLEIWTSVEGKITRTVRGVKRTVGVNCLAEVRKNRITGKIGKDRSVIFPIYYDHGIDDVGACVDFLVENGHWLETKKDSGLFIATELTITASRNKLIHHIEDKNLENSIRHLCGEVWGQIEDEARVERKPRYT